MSRKGKSEFLSAMGTGWEIWRAIVNAVLEKDSEHADEKLRALIGNDEKLAVIAAEILDEAKAARMPVETITVPDLSEKELLALVEKQAHLTGIDHRFYTKCDFVRDNRGKTYEVLTWEPGRSVSSVAVCEHFEALGFKGNTAAFVAWVARNHLVGGFASITVGKACVDLGFILNVPFFIHDGVSRKLSLRAFADDWDGCFIFVAFREIPQEKRIERKLAERETITVLDLPAKALLALMEERASLTYLNSDYQEYAFIRDERGKTFEVLTWKPGHYTSSNAVYEHFKALGFKGNTAAFVAWVTKNHPMGWFASIPEDDECFGCGGVPLAPYFHRDDSCRGLDLYPLAGGGHDAYVFVAFREISSK